MWLVSVFAARGEDSDQLRYYFNFRAQGTKLLTEVHDREDIEEMAQAEGRTAGAVWAKAVAKARKAEASL
ncbi:MAG: hypothetical protein ACREA0_03490 [bacterium]